MHCYLPNTMNISHKVIKPIYGLGFKNIKQDDVLPKESMNSIDKRVDTLQQKMRQVNLQPLKSKMKAIKISF